jgi:(1->4)-alpha-D-glucan 1-alpha-D-glucosylmutase
MALIAEAALPGLLDEIVTLVGRIAAAGAVNGLAQCLLRLTVPGVPDLYQGTEFWDFSLVDPDNRRPVDFAARVAALGDSDFSALAACWRDGRIKQALIARLLALRGRTPALFAEGSYVPVPVVGSHAASIVSFVRRHREHWLLAAVPRLPLGMLQRSDDLAIAPAAWSDTALQLESVPTHAMFDGWTGVPVELVGGRTSVGRLCTALPLVLLTTQG